MIVSITIHAPGMAAELVESEITDLVERALMNVPGVRRVRSMSSQDRSYLEAGFGDISAEAALPDVHAALAAASLRWPAAVAEPVLRIEPARLSC